MKTSGIEWYGVLINAFLKILAAIDLYLVVLNARFDKFQIVDLGSSVVA